MQSNEMSYKTKQKEVLEKIFTEFEGKYSKGQMKDAYEKVAKINNEKDNYRY